MATNATIRVSFGVSGMGEESYYISAEVDDRDAADGGLNGGVTSFSPGDPVAILVYHSANINVDSVTASAGSASIGGSVTVTKKDVECIFENTKTASISIPAQSISNQRWIGQSLGTASLTADKQNVQVGNKGLGVLMLDVTTTANVVNLTNTLVPGFDNFSIVVFVTGSKA